MSSLIDLQNLEGPCPPPPSFRIPWYYCRSEPKSEFRVCSKSIRTKLACKFPWGHFKLDPKRINREKAMSKKGHSLLVLLVSIVSNQGKKPSLTEGVIQQLRRQNFCHFLPPPPPPPPLRGHFSYPERGQKQTFFDLLKGGGPHLVHVVIEWPRIKVEFAFVHSVSHFMV